MTPYVSIICQQAGHVVASEYAKLVTEVGLPVLLNFPTLEGYEQTSAASELVNPNVCAIILVISSDFFPGSGRKSKVRIPPQVFQALRSASSDMGQMRLIPAVIDDDSPDFIEKTWLKDLQHFRDGPIERERVREMLRVIANGDAIPNALYSFENVRSIIEAIEPGSDVCEIGSVRESTEKIGYKLFAATNRIKETKTFFVYLNKGVSLAQTSKRLRKDHPKVFEEKNKHALLGIEPGHVRLNDRLENVKKVFNCENAHYLENILSKLINLPARNKLTGSSSSTIEREFVEPQIRYAISSSSAPKPFSEIEDWLTASNAELRVMRGQGGIGKTWAMLHLRQKASMSRLEFEKPGDRTIMFIASTDVNKVMPAASDHHDEITLYDLYVSSQDRTSAPPLGKETLYNAIELGSLIIFIDGFDEIIARNRSRFSASTFFSDLESLFGFGSNAKVLISCRNIFFDQEESLWTFPFVDCFELLAFDGKRRDKFFEDGLPGMPKRIAQAKELSENLAKLPDGRYVPFVLSLVKDIVLESADGTAKINLHRFQSEILDENDINDRIVGQFCNREVSKIPDRLRTLTVDQQVLAFCQIARTKEAGNGLPQSTTVRHILEKITDRKDVDSLVKHLAAHPFISQDDYKKNEVFEFRFDFLPEYFLMLDASINSADGRRIELADIRIMNKYCNANSLFSNGFVRRFKGEELGFFLRLLEMKTESWDVAEAKLPAVDLDILRPESAVAQFSFSIVSLLATYVAKDGRLDSERFTNGIYEIFGEDGTVRNMAILDGYFKEEERVRIDFRGKQWEKCLFHSVDIWSCQYNSESKFTECKFQHCEGIYKQESGILDAQFGANCIYDDVFERIFATGSKKFESNEARVVEDVKSFISDFHRQGAFWSKNLENLERYYAKSNPSVPFKKMLRRMRHRNVIIENDMGHYVDVALSKNVIAAAERLITQGVLEGILADVVIDLRG